MNFKIWLEAIGGGGSYIPPPGMGSNIPGSNMPADAAPASAEVLRTGLQPQVDSKEIKTKEKETTDKMMAIDSHLQRVKQAADSIDGEQNPKLKKLKKLCNSFLDDWDNFQKEDRDDQGYEPDGFNLNPKQVDFMRKNQPLPEIPRPGVPGTFGIT